MGTITQFRLGLRGTVVAPTSPLQKELFIQNFSTFRLTRGSKWQATSLRSSFVDVCCERRSLGPLMRPWSKTMCFDPLSKQRERLAIKSPAVQDGGQIAPLSVDFTDSEAPANLNSKEVAEEITQGKDVELSTATLLWRAAKLPIYSVCIIPLTVGVAAAYWQTGIVNGARYWLMLWSSILIITWLNLSNDAYDAETGVDKFKKESVVNITGSRQGVLWAAFACLVLGLGGLVAGASQAGDTRVATLLVLAIACGYVYQCPPFRLSYKGLGEPLCFFAFGPFATTAFYLSQAQPSPTAVLPVTAAILGASVLVGITTSLILFCSHFHQIESDTAAGKMSPLVTLGTEKGSKVVQAAVIGLYTILAFLSVCRSLPLTCPLFALITAPIGKVVVDFVQKNHTNKERIFMAKYFAVRLHVAFGLALILGFSLASKSPLPVLR